MRHVHDPRAPLTNDMRRQLETLAAMPDAEIDLSDIPERTEAQFRSAVRGGFAPKSPQTLALYLTAAVAAWLTENAHREAHSINFALKQVVQHTRRAARERAEKSARPIYDETADEFRYAIELLSGRAQPTSELPDLPEYADSQLASYGVIVPSTLEPHTVTLSIDDEVAGWLIRGASSHSLRVQFALNRLMLLHTARQSRAALDKAS